jgi:two-component system, NarL family, sensor histidine kinase LiaS
MFKRQSEIIKLMYLYRYISLICTSAFYFIGVTSHPIGRKLFIIICITLSSVILSNLYIKNIGDTAHILLLISIETLGNILLLIPSGGIKSPYVWYCLNTILIASVELKKRYCWANLFIYLLVANWISQIVLTKKPYSFIEALNNESNLTLSFILVTTAMQLLAKYAGDIEKESRKLSAVVGQLNTANQRIRKSMVYIMELYQAINLLSIQNNTNQVLELINHYAKKSTMAKTVLFYSITNDQKQLIIDTDGSCEIEREELKAKLDELPGRGIDADMPINMKFYGKEFLLVFVKSSYIIYGILGIEIMQQEDVDEYMSIVEQLKILSGLSSIVLQKIELENVNARLLIAEEQNRIASEIHDSVLQRLFSISCGIFTLARQQEGLGRVQMNDDLQLIRNSIRNIMKDLRTTIYGLSWQKEGTDNFLPDLRSRINEIRSMNGNEINFIVNGDPSQLSVFKKKSLYRIICEGIGNAIHHGKASKIDVTLEVWPTETILKIYDNGVGFNVENARTNGRKGLGINNIHQLTYSLDGSIRIDSEPGKGTEIEIGFPNNQNYKEQII